MCGCTWSGSCQGTCPPCSTRASSIWPCCFDTQPARRWSVLPLLEERLFLIRSAQRWRAQTGAAAQGGGWRSWAMSPLILPTGPHGLRSRLDTAFAQARVTPRLAMEIDSLALLMDAVDMGLGSTIQPWAAVGRYADAGERFVMAEIWPTPQPSGPRRCAACRTTSSRPPRWPRAWCWATACASWCSQASGGWIGAALHKD
jgi:LysR family tcuABC transcriptional regulator